MAQQIPQQPSQQLQQQHQPNQPSNSQQLPSLVHFSYECPVNPSWKVAPLSLNELLTHKKVFGIEKRKRNQLMDYLKITFLRFYELIFKILTFFLVQISIMWNMIKFDVLLFVIIDYIHYQLNSFDSQ